jgi:SAM-dependent methyltransferase
MSGYRKDLAESYTAVADDRRETVFPLLLARLREASAGGRLLDFGGGDGEFARLASELPLERILTYDLSPAMTALAARRCAGFPRVTAVGTTADLTAGELDAVVSNGVWMCWQTEVDCITNLGEIARLLSPGGTFIASVTHPCFRDGRFATYRTDFDPALYLEDGTRFRVKVFDGTQQVELEDTHWSLGAMTRQLRAAGLQLATITEVADRSGAVGCPWMIVEAHRG